MTLRSLVVTEPAQTDLADIRNYTVARYGQQGLDAYDGLIRRALADLRTDPMLAGSRDRASDLEISGIRSVHLALFRNRSVPSVGKPRHLFLYLVPDELQLVILRLLHDTSDLTRLLPKDEFP